MEQYIDSIRQYRTSRANGRKVPANISKRILKSPHVTPEDVKEILSTYPLISLFLAIAKNRRAMEEQLWVVFNSLELVSPSKRESATSQVYALLVNHKNTPSEVLQKIADHLLDLPPERALKGWTFNNLVMHKNTPIPSVVSLVEAKTKLYFAVIDEYIGQVDRMEAKDRRELLYEIMGIRAFLRIPTVPEEMLSKIVNKTLNILELLPNKNRYSGISSLTDGLLANPELSKRMFNQIMTELLEQTKQLNLIGLPYVTPHPGLILNHQHLTKEISDQVIDLMPETSSTIRLLFSIPTNKTPDFVLVKLFKLAEAMGTVETSKIWGFNEALERLVSKKNFPLELSIRILESPNYTSQFKQAAFKAPQVRRYYTRELAKASGVFMKDLPGDWVEAIVV